MRFILGPYVYFLGPQSEYKKIRIFGPLRVFVANSEYYVINCRCLPHHDSDSVAITCLLLKLACSTHRSLTNSKPFFYFFLFFYFSHVLIYSKTTYTMTRTTKGHTIANLKN